MTTSKEFRIVLSFPFIRGLSVLYVKAKDSASAVSQCLMAHPMGRVESWIEVDEQGEDQGKPN